jgi:ATP-dependent exoDNAse (exonuclease V) alpha subunit
MSISQQKLQELLARARAQASEADKATAKELSDHVATSVPGGADFTAAGISDAAIQTDAGADAAVEVLKDVISNMSSGSASAEKPAEVGHKEAGVARKVTLNEKQELAVSKVVNGESIVLIGAAGTGKTTSVRQMTERLLESNSLPKLSISTKWLLQGKPGVAILSYTRKAVNNIRHAVVENLRPHVITIHKLLEYQPVYYQIEDPDNAGQFKNTMRFEPTRNSDNPLPAQLALAYPRRKLYGSCGLVPPCLCCYAA